MVKVELSGQNITEHCIIKHSFCEHLLYFSFALNTYLIFLYIKHGISVGWYESCPISLRFRQFSCCNSDQAVALVEPVKESFKLLVFTELSSTWSNGHSLWYPLSQGMQINILGQRKTLTKSIY